MYVRQTLKQAKLDNVNSNNNQRVALSFKDPRVNDRVLTIDVPKSTFQELLKNFAKNNFILNGDGSVKLEGEASKFISSWWESVAYKKQHQADNLSIRGFRDIESPYIKQNYIRFGIINQQFNHILKMFKEDGKSLKIKWIAAGITLMSLDNSENIKEFKKDKKELDEKKDRIPTIFYLYFRE